MEFHCTVCGRTFSEYGVEYLEHECHPPICGTCGREAIWAMHSPSLCTGCEEFVHRCQCEPLEEEVSDASF